MRNYYKATVDCNQSPLNTLDRFTSRHICWELFEALLRGFPVTWRPELKEKLIEAIKLRNPLILSGLLDKVDSYAQLYSKATHPDTVVFDRRALAFLKKYPFKSKDYDPRENAITKWRDAELQCKTTNERICKGDLTSSDWVYKAQHLIAECLPQLDSKTLNKVFTEGDHGPGATLTSNTEAGKVTPYYKYAELPYSCTASAQRYALAAISSNSRWMNHLENTGRRAEMPQPGTPQYQLEMQIFSSCVKVIEPDRITFVPKNMLTHRPIAISSSLNMFLQLGVKSVLEKSLRKVGVNLRDQTRNQELARLGSLGAYCNKGQVNPEQYCTIDLASASDTVSYEIVKLLLPPEWFSLLADLRHNVGDLDGELVEYHKFSAMGNGYTFPLESLIFWAISKASMDKDPTVNVYDDLAVYGDDIIIRQKYVDTTVSNLREAGFLINQEKSFFQGEFKESCGADYFRGINVRPFYLKRELTTYEDIYFVCNSMQTYVNNSGYTQGYSRIYSAALAVIPKKVRLYAPLSVNSTNSLSVPLSYMRHIGLQPFVSFNEWSRYFKYSESKSTSFEYTTNKCVLNDNVYFSGNTCYYKQFSCQPQYYSGNRNLRIMLAIKSVSTTNLHEFLTMENYLHIEAAAEGKITRKSRLSSSMSLTPIPSWDGKIGSVRARRHLVWFS